MPIDPELARLRRRMDAINRRLVDALHARAQLCRAIGRWKSARGLPAIDRVRERQMLATLLRQLPRDGFARKDLVTIVSAVFAASRRLVKKRVR
ncbi:MAG: chorismate mutase [Planctomycetota bacterium]